MKPEEILARINEARTRKNIGYTYIIKNTGFGKTYVSKALNGKLSIGLKNLCMLCDCLGLELVVKDVETNETQS